MRAFASACISEEGQHEIHWGKKMKNTYYRLFFPFIYVFFLAYRHISMTSMVPLTLVWIISIPIIVQAIKNVIYGRIRLLLSDWIFVFIMIVLAFNSLERIQKSNYGTVWFWYYISSYAVLLDVLFLYHFYEKEFLSGLRILNLFIFATLIVGICEHLIYKYLLHVEMWRITSVYINTFMLATVALFYLFLPNFFEKKVCIILSVLISLLCIIFSYSRNIWVALVLVILIHSVLFFKTHKKRIVTLLHDPKIKCGIIACVVVCVLFLVLSGTLTDIIGRLHVDKEGTSYQVRMVYLKYAVRELFPSFSKREILCGRGYRASRAAVTSSGIQIFDYEAFDNMYLTLIYEYGLLGLIALLIVLYKMIVVLNNSKKKVSILEHKDMAYCSAMICVAALVPTGFYEISDWHSVYFILLMSIGVVFVEYHRIRNKCDMSMENGENIIE